MQKHIDLFHKRFAKIITRKCYRDTFIEELHSGTFPKSKIGDYSDVVVKTPYGEIPWSELSRISDPEMKRLNKEVCNKVYSTITYLYKHVKFFGWVVRLLVDNDIMPDWDDPEDVESKEMNEAKISEKDKKLEDIGVKDLYYLRMI